MKQYVVDAFTDRVFAGNPAAVCVMENWLPDEIMQKIAAENNLSETAFQASPRGGIVYCENKGDRVLISGKAALYCEAEIFIKVFQ